MLYSKNFWIPKLECNLQKFSAVIFFFSNQKKGSEKFYVRHKFQHVTNLWAFDPYQEKFLPLRVSFIDSSRFIHG